MKLSIIIPYYKTPELTKELLEKLNEQKTEDIEIIVIDDDIDNDNSWIKDMVDIYIKNEVNCGGAGSRNIGLGVASAEYITFIDCDDMIYENYISLILESLKQDNNLTWISWRSIYGDAIVKSIEQPNIAPWGCVYKRKIFDNIKFNEKLNIGEEPEFWTEVFNTFPDLRIGYIDKIIYYYNIREDSATRRYWRGELPKERNLQ